MRIKHKYILHLLMICIITYTGLCNASPSAFSNYGNIQNVQSYSSNPYWNPNSPYNQRMPTPVYVDGPDAKSGDCNQIAAQLIAQQCGMRNNCRDTKLKDIRPALMMQLTQMPGANYATSCAGYLDGAFDNYVKQNTGFDKNARIAFPDPTIKTNAPTQAIVSTLPTTQPKQQDNWKADMAARRAELEALREQSGANKLPTATAEMPKVAADFSFEERKANATEGYKPYAGTSAFKTITIESKEAYLDRRIRIAAKRREWCEAKYGTTTQTLREDLAKLKACRAAGTPIEQCQTTGSY